MDGCITILCHLPIASYSYNITLHQPMTSSYINLCHHHTAAASPSYRISSYIITLRQLHFVVRVVSVGWRCWACLWHAMGLFCMSVCMFCAGWRRTPHVSVYVLGMFLIQAQASYMYPTSIFHVTNKYIRCNQHTHSLCLCICQVEAYANQIEPVVDAIKYLTPLGFDALTFVILTRLAQERDKVRYGQYRQYSSHGSSKVLCVRRPSGL